VLTRAPPAEIEELAGAHALSALGPRLDELHAAAGASVLARRTYLESWARVYSDFDPWVVAVAVGKDLLAALPLARRRRRWGWTEIVPMGHGVSGHTFAPARDERSARSLGAAVARRLQAMRGPWRLAVAHVHPEEPALGALCDELAVRALAEGDGAPLLRFDQGRELREYASHNLRRTLQKRRNRIRRAGLTAEIDHVGDPTEIRELLPELASLRRRRMLSFGGRDEPTSRPARFRATVLARLADEGAVEVTTLRLDGELAAYAIGLLDGRCYRLWETHFEPTRGWFGVGLLVQAAMLERVLADPRFVECDLERGLDQHKLQLTRTVVPGSDLTAWSSPAVRALDHFARYGRTRGYYRWLARYALDRLPRGRALGAGARPRCDNADQEVLARCPPDC
jgi:CelD/BcsL family acetyltransferase involved in cellulose biosynthesis